jgi:hypothetical protein
MSMEKPSLAERANPIGFGIPPDTEPAPSPVPLPECGGESSVDDGAMLRVRTRSVVADVVGRLCSRKRLVSLARVFSNLDSLAEQRDAHDFALGCKCIIPPLSQRSYVSLSLFSLISFSFLCVYLLMVSRCVVDR